MTYTGNLRKLELISVAQDYNLKYNNLNYNIDHIIQRCAMDKFIDRDSELNLLNKEYSSGHSAFVVIYGRRRVGKTALIQEFIKDKPAVYFLATEESEIQNREAFRLSVADFFNDNLLKSASVSTWLPLFERIVENKSADKLIIVIDEFQYLGKANATFPSVFQKIWDTVLKNANIMIILCGSLITMMEAQTLHYTSPLYGRRTAQIKLKPIQYKFYHEFYTNLDTMQLIEHYAVTGGVPKYIELFGKNADVYTAINDHVLATSGFLYEEPVFLLRNEVYEIGSYFSIIKVIAAGNTKPGKIASILEIPQTSLSKYLYTLIELDIIEREVPVTEDNPSKSKKGLYKIKDNFIRFWFRFVYPYRSYLERGETAFVMNKIRQNFIDGHVSYVFEDICREMLWKKSAEGSLPFTPAKIGRWWNNTDTEIDVAAIDDQDDICNIIVGECKYWKDAVGLNILNKLEEKSKLIEWHRDSRKIWYALFSVSGFTDELQAEASARNDILLFDFDA